MNYSVRRSIQTHAYPETDFTAEQQLEVQSQVYPRTYQVYASSGISL